MSSVNTIKRCRRMILNDLHQINGTNILCQLQCSHLNAVHVQD